MRAIVPLIVAAAQSLAARTNDPPWHGRASFELVMTQATAEKLAKLPELQGRMDVIRPLTAMVGFPVRIDPTMRDDVILLLDPRTFVSEVIEVR